MTKKDEKKARPTGRGDGGPQQRGGRQGALLCPKAFESVASRIATSSGQMGGSSCVSLYSEQVLDII